MADGWLLDITDASDGASVHLWLKDAATGSVRALTRPFRPPILVDGPRERKERLAKLAESWPDVASVDEWVGRPSLFDHRRRTLVALTVKRNQERRRVGARVDAFGDYREFMLYDVDLTAPQLYHLTHGLYPFAPVTGPDDALKATEPAEKIDYTIPPIATALLSVELEGHGRSPLAPADAPIERIRLGSAELEGSEESLLRELPQELRRQEPDLLLTDAGDDFDLPRLYRRAEACGLSPTTFVLGREPVTFQPARPAGSYESYGRILHQSAAYLLPGRFHIDRENSFWFEDTYVDGLVDAARLSRLSLQTVVRQSPGTSFTAMEIAQALKSGVHVPWKKNRPERFKSALKLVAADRGGVIFLPPVGVHDFVEEFDFTSLYPNIMVRHNLSAETLDCACCPKSPRVAPGLGYRSCTRRVGLIPRTLGPLVDRRLAYKARIRDPKTTEAERQVLKHRARMLKWVLVTAFGYQGYRNARFGRIECHEAINAYARELLKDLVHFAEESGYSFVHGIVDSMWLKPSGRRPGADPEGFSTRASEKFGLPLGYEGRYKWIVFLPAVTHGLGVPNRYYGMYETGEFKLRGIGSRRHDTPTVLRRAEGEVLNAFARADDAKGVVDRLPLVLARLDRFAERIREHDWPIEELVIAHRIGQDPGSFTTFTDSVAALRQLNAHGVKRSAGETVRYVLRDRRSRSIRDRVTVAERLPGDGRYDAAAYLVLLARSAETLLAPLGVTRESLLERWGAPPDPERDRYRSVEDEAQTELPEEGVAG